MQRSYFGIFIKNGERDTRSPMVFRAGTSRRNCIGTRFFSLVRYNRTRVRSKVSSTRIITQTT